jgi:ribosomal protein S12 methylthiotransferase
LLEAGVMVVEDPAACTHILINTCGFIQDAKEESVNTVLNACARYPGRAVLVMGCLVERYRAELAEGIPEVAGWFGPAGENVESELRRVLAGGRLERGKASGASSHAVAAHAYLKISDGCDEPCSFCAIPAIKGPYYSVALADILREADSCLAGGARELTLVGQDTSRWTGEGLDLMGLVDTLSADERVKLIRVMYLQPERVTGEFLRYMASQPKICRYLDVPFQHSHRDVLRRMARGGDGDSYLELLERARRLTPDVSVRSTFIVGFPGEKKEHFEDLLRFVEKAGFDYAGGFVYSPEEGTMAAGFRPRVARAVARDRLNRLSALLGECAEREHLKFVGSQVEVMIDAVDARETGDEAMAVGRTAGQAPEVDGVTYVEGGLPSGIVPGDIVRVTVTAAVGYDLVGEYDGAP